MYIKDFEGLLNEVSFQTSRSSGKGGQNVNKVSTKVMLIFDIQNSKVLNDIEKQILLHKLENRVNKQGFLQLSCSKERSQFMNKELVIEKFYTLLEKALIPEKERRQTKPTKASKIKDRQEKLEQSIKKASRKRIEILHE